MLTEFYEVNFRFHDFSEVQVHDPEYPSLSGWGMPLSLTPML